jgi:tetratricopeptide (TPR) repeat protein
MYAIKGDNPGQISDAQALEQKGELNKAAVLYEKLLKKSPSNLRIIQRLLVIFRKLKNVKKELYYIEVAIKIHRKKYMPVQTFNKKTTALSKQLNKMLGHTDKKGVLILVSDDIVKLELRKSRLFKKQSATDKK